ncbi:uncharacterized protein [Nicotiana tomentosiformis]|uniref:uncharacterized protein isoform X2 n=1 Tax=Nicotiana tomentosiformis TaxID=4098 RepID=UPI00388CCE8F
MPEKRNANGKEMFQLAEVVSQELKVSNESVSHQVAAGGAKGSVYEPRIIQHKVIDSTIAGDDRPTNAKKNAAAAVFEKPCIEPAAVGSKLEANVTGNAPNGRCPVSGAVVPVAEALARVAQDLKSAENTVVNRGIAGASKGSAIEPGHLQQMMDDSALAAAIRAIYAKNNAADAVLGQFDKAGK